MAYMEILYREDLNMPTGKLIGQLGHALYVAWLNRMSIVFDNNNEVCLELSDQDLFDIANGEVKYSIKSAPKEIVLSKRDSVFHITDLGKTIFNEETVTCSVEFKDLAYNLNTYEIIKNKTKHSIDTKDTRQLILFNKKQCFESNPLDEIADILLDPLMSQLKRNGQIIIKKDSPQYLWLFGDMTKIVLKVRSSKSFESISVMDKVARHVMPDKKSVMLVTNPLVEQQADGISRISGVQLFK